MTDEELKRQFDGLHYEIGRVKDEASDKGHFVVWVLLFIIYAALSRIGAQVAVLYDKLK